MLAVELIIVFVLIIVNGLLAMSEMAVVSARRARLTSMSDGGNRGAQKAINLAKSPGRFLSTVQIGITLVGVLAGAFSGATLADRLGGVLAGYGFPNDTADDVAFALVVAAITYLSLIIGELVPKQIALRSPERVASLIAGPMQLLSWIATPVVALLDLSSRVLLRLFGSSRDDGVRVTDDEIRALIAEAEATGVVQAGERRMLSGVMRLADRGVRAIMTPRLDIDWIDLTASDEAILRAIRGSERSRLVACDGGPDNIVGVLNARDVLQNRIDGERKPVRDFVKPPVLLPDTLGALQAIERLHETGDGFGLVVDEYGNCEGVVTPADAWTAISGTSGPSTPDDEAMVVKRGDGSLLLSGALPLDNLEEVLSTKLPRDHPYHTLAGLLLFQMRRVPKAGEAVDVAGWRFEVVDMDGRRIDQVLVSRCQGTVDQAPQQA